MPHFCNFLLVENISSEAVFDAVNGISHVNGPILTTSDHWFGSWYHLLEANLQASPGCINALFFEERKKTALKNLDTPAP